MQAKSGAAACARARDHAWAISRRVSPESCDVTSPDGGQRAQGRPGAGGTRRSVRHRSAHGVDHGLAERPAFPARLVLTVSFVLSPGSDALLPPSPCRWLTRAPGRAAASPQALTHRPRASGPHDFSVRGRPRLNARGLACARPRHRRDRCYGAVSFASARCLTVARPGITLIRAGAAASTATRPASRYDREAPLWQAGMREDMP